MYCTKCGRELKPNDRFCAHCGAEVVQSPGEQNKYDNVVFNPPFRMEAEKKTAQILKNREDFKGFRELAEENSKRAVHTKAKMDWNLDGFPESLTANNGKSGFDWGSVVERKKSGRSLGYEKLDMTSTMEHKKVVPEDIDKAVSDIKEDKASLGLPPEDSRVISLEELEKELYDLEEELRTDTARTAKYEPFKLEDIDNSDELDAYLDGLQKTKKTPEKPEPKEAPAAEPVMRWNLDDDSKAGKGQKAASSMGLVWGIDPKDVAKKKAAKAHKDVKMVWNLEEKERLEAEAKAKAEEEARKKAEEESRLRAEEEARKKAEEESRLRAEAEARRKAEEEARLRAEEEARRKAEEEARKKAEEEARIEAEAEAIRKAEEEARKKAEEEARLRAEEEAKRKAEEEAGLEDNKASEEESQTEETIRLDVMEEYNDLVKNAEPEYLEKTRIFDQDSIKMAAEEVETVEKAEQEEAGEPESPFREELSEEVHEEPESVKAPLYQSDFVHPWEEPKEAEKETEAEEEIPSETPSPEEQEEAPAEEPKEAPAVTEEEPVGKDRPAFYTFSKKNEAFQELLMKEKKRLEDMGANYVPQNESSKVEVSKIVENTPETLAYEENGHYVEGVVQPVETIYADLSGDPKPNLGKFPYSYVTDTDWLREMTSQNDLSSINKTKLRYSDLFPSPLADERFEGTGVFKEKTEEEKKEIAADINKIFDEDEATKPKKHIVGNIIITLLLLVILFEGSVLAAKLIAPDSKYSHITDGVIEKVLNIFSKSDGSTDSGDATAADSEDVDPEDINTDEKDSDAAYYQGIISTLSQNITDITEIFYSEDLTFSSLDSPAYDDVVGADPLVDSDWYESEDGSYVTYAESIYSSVLDYYGSWAVTNNNADLLGINRLDLGEIVEAGDGYYVLTEAIYMTAEGSTETKAQTFYLTEKDNSMFIEEIKEETING